MSCSASFSGSGSGGNSDCCIASAGERGCPVCNSVGRSGTGQKDNEGTSRDHEGLKWRGPIFGRLGGGQHPETSEQSKKLHDRRGYAWRQFKAAEKGGKESVSHAGQGKEKGNCGGNKSLGVSAEADSQCWKSRWNGLSQRVGSAGDFEGSAREEKQGQESWRQRRTHGGGFRSFIKQFGRHHKTEGCRESLASLQEGLQRHETKTCKACEKIHQRGGTFPGGIGRCAVPADGLQQAAQLGKTPKFDADPFCNIPHLTADVEEQASASCPRVDATIEGPSPMLVGQWGLENGMVADRAPRPCGKTPIWGRAPGARGNCLIPQSNGRAREERKIAASTNRQQPRQGQAGKGKKEGRKARSSRGESGSVTAEKRFAELDHGLSAGLNPIFELINKQHGSFCIYYRIHESMSQQQTGAITPDLNQVGRSPALFPSRLPWLVPGKSKRRRGLSVEVKHEAFMLMHRIWAFLNYLHAGSPCSTSAIRQAVRMASEGEWTAHHETYARAMHSKLLDYCTCPRGTMERGSAKLSVLIEKVQCSQYDPSISFDDAACGALPVDPTRISLPDQAGILDPKKHLCGDRLKQFLEMPLKIPEPCRSSVDPPACHKVSDEDWPVVLRKLYEADMITFIPKRDVLSEGRRVVCFVYLINPSLTD